MERWLSLKILESSLSQNQSKKACIHISVPKRAVKLAVTRNRIKRVLREAVRRDPFFERAGIYRLQVRQLPQKVDLSSARAILEELHD